LNNKINHLDLTNIHKPLVPNNSRMHILLECTWYILQDRPYSKPQTKSPNILKGSIVQGIFSDHNRMKLEIKSRKKTGKFTNSWKLNNKSQKTNQSNKISSKKLENT